MDKQYCRRPSEPFQLRRYAERVLITLRLLRVSSNVTAAIAVLESPKELTLSRTQSLWEAVELLTIANNELASALSVALDYLEKNTAQS
jgi:hypothetical protein